MIFVNCPQKNLAGMLIAFGLILTLLTYIDFLNAPPISAKAFLFYQSKANYRLAEDDIIYKTKV